MKEIEVLLWAAAVLLGIGQGFVTGRVYERFESKSASEGKGER
jgi:hypothetical protein